jgi:hypothetical protein
MTVSLSCSSTHGEFILLFAHLQSVWHIVVHNALREALHHSSLSNAWLADQARVVLCAA